MYGCDKITEADLKHFLQNNELCVTDVARMNVSSGVLNIIELNDIYSINLSCVWNNGWTKKWKEMSNDNFREWMTKRLTARAEKDVDKLLQEMDTIRYTNNYKEKDND